MSDLDDIDALLSGRTVSPARRGSNFLLALLSTLPAAVLFVQIFVVDISRSQLTILAGVLATSALLSLSYENLSVAASERIRNSTSPPTKASFKGRKGEFDAAIKEHEKSLDWCALVYAVFYCNAVFLVTAPFIGCYICAGKFSGDLNFLVSSGAAAGLALFNSQSAMKALTA